MIWNWRTDLHPSTGNDYSVIHFIKLLLCDSGSCNFSCNSVIILSGGDSEDGDGDGGGGGAGRPDTFIRQQRYYLSKGFLTSQLYG